MIEEEMFPSVLTNSHWRSEEYDANISRGIQLGSKLGKKLQVRGESRETKWTRLDSGRIDKRLVVSWVLVMRESFQLLLLIVTKMLLFIFQLMLVVLWVETNGTSQ